MRIVVEQRYVKKADGKLWLQCKYLDGGYLDASGSLGLMQSRVSDWEDVPICYDEWPDAAGEG